MKRIKHRYLFSFSEIDLADLIEKTKGYTNKIVIEAKPGDDRTILAAYECVEETDEEYANRVAADEASTKRHELAMLKRLKEKYE